MEGATLNNKGNWFLKGLFFIILCAIWFLGGIGRIVGSFGANYVQSSGMRGITAWLFANFNIVFIVFLLLFIVGWTVVEEVNAR